MNRWIVSAALGLGLWVTGCEKPVAAPVAAAIDNGEPTAAQPKLPTMKLYMQSEEMLAELAVTPDQVRTGMMFRTNMAPNSGMLFALPYTHRASFWMKNCPLPLSAAFMDEDGIIQEIHDLQPYNTNSVVAGVDTIRFVLETPQGWFRQHHIGPGVAVTTERGPLMRTFFRAR